MPFVYKITTNGKHYIGVSKDVQKRIKTHKTSDSYIGRAILKYCYSVEILFQGSLEECFEKEISLIEKLSTKYPNGYNLTKGGEGVVEETEEVRLKRSQSMKRIMSDPIRKSKAAKGIKWTEEQRQKKSTAAKIQMNDPQMKLLNSKRLSERLRKLWADPDYRIKMSEKAKRQWATGGLRNSK